MSRREPFAIDVRRTVGFRDHAVLTGQGRARTTFARLAILCALAAVALSVGAFFFLRG